MVILTFAIISMFYQDSSVCHRYDPSFRGVYGAITRARNQQGQDVRDGSKLIFICEGDASRPDGERFQESGLAPEANRSRLGNAQFVQCQDGDGRRDAVFNLQF
jgi:hypothetical protein